MCTINNWLNYLNSGNGSALQTLNAIEIQYVQRTPYWYCHMQTCYLFCMHGFSTSSKSVKGSKGKVLVIWAYSSQHQSAYILLQYTAGLLLKINLCSEEVLETIKGKVTIMKTMTFIVTLSLPVCVHSIVLIVPHMHLHCTSILCSVLYSVLSLCHTNTA